jgi:predicted HAD superfamily Cof-like phosphohydrolase
MEKCFRDLIDFHRAVDQMPPDGPPAVPDVVTVMRRIKLLREEFGELLEAIEAGDLPKIADGIADLNYVAGGTAVAYGIDLVPVWNAVHAANMTKTTGPIREDGKRMKPPGFKHPDIGAILDVQRPLAEIYKREDE